MKLQSLRINHFGHFANYELDLQQAPFVVVHGHNEAGKSTLLEFLRKALFGFDDRERYSFGDGGEIGGRLKFELKNGQQVDLSRRKGRKNTVQVRIDDTETNLDDAGFKRLIGDPDANLFKSVFAFGLDELRQAEKSLEHQSIQSALFAGGLGGTLNPRALLDSLTARAEEIFKANGRNQSINVVCKELSDLGKDLRSAIVKPDEYLDRQRRWQEQQALADALANQLTSLRSEHSQVESVLKALPIGTELKQLRAERAQISVPQRFPHNARSAFEANEKELQRLTAECTQLQNELATTKQALRELNVDTEALTYSAAITECWELAGRYREARDELPSLRHKHATGMSELIYELREQRPGWTIDNLREFSLNAAHQHRLSELLQRRAELNTQETTLQAKLAAAQEQLDSTLDELNSLENVADVSSLSVLVEQANDYSADARAVAKEREARMKLHASFDAQLLKLKPVLPEVVQNPERLPVPSKELALTFERDVRDASLKSKSLQNERDAKAKALRQAQDELRRLESQHRTVPKREELLASRQQRDEQWQAIRTEVIEGSATVSPVSPNEFQSSMTSADQIADSIYEHAEQVAQRERCELDLQQAELELQAAQQADDEQQRVIEQWQARWREHWQPLGINPLPPEAMARWIDEHAKLVELQHQLRTKDIEIEVATKRCSEFEQRLLAAVSQSTSNSSAGTTDVSTALANAKKAVKVADMTNDRRKTLERDRKKHLKAVQTLESNRLEWQTQQAEWEAARQTLLAQLELPQELSIDNAHRVIERLRSTQKSLKQLTEWHGSIATLESRLAEFEPRVAQLAQQVSEPLDADRPEVTARQMHERAKQAQAAKQRRAQLVEQETERANKLADRTREKLRGESLRRDFWSAAGLGHLLPQEVASMSLKVQSTESMDLPVLDLDALEPHQIRQLNAEFLQVAERVERAAKLDTKLAQLDRELALLRGAESVDAFEQRLAAAPESEWRQQLIDIQSRLIEVERQERESRQEAGGLKHAFEELDGTSKAAALHESSVLKQSQLITEIHRYVPLVFARRLLQTAIERFERENQPELINNISKLFASLTRGEYEEIERPTVDRSAIYVRRKDKVERSPDELSTGTREQLYLAIRLGYIQHYCNAAEPLPIVMDDVLVNFDLDRTRATLATLREFSKDVQVLFFTCHDYMVDVIRDAVPEAVLLRVNRHAA